MARTTTRDIRSASRFEVLRAIYSGDAATRRALAEQTDVSFATVANVVAELLAAGVLVEHSYESSAGGRPRARLAVNGERGHLLGVAISETHVRVELFDLSLRPLAHVMHPLAPDRFGAEELVAVIASAADGMVSEQVLGVGVSLSAHVAHDGDVPLFAGVGPSPGGSLRSLLSQELGLPVLVDNPLKAAAIAELWFGAGHGAHTLITVTVTIGTGTGAGMTVRGSLLRGVSDSAGEWGHTTLILDGERCRCGALGCVEAYIGAPGILRDWQAAGGPPAASTSDELAGIGLLAAALSSGDQVASEVIARSGRYLGAGLANLINVLNPDTVVLGGWLVDDLGPWLLPAALAEAAKRALRRPFEAVRILRSPISGHRTCLGMATFALEEFLSATGLPSRQRTIARSAS